jgi:hypothetical protein
MTDTETKILHDDRQRSLKILASAGLKGLTFAMIHPAITRRHLKAVTAPHPRSKQ